MLDEFDKIASWIQHSPSNAICGAVGGLLGVFFGLDAWRQSGANTSFKGSHRFGDLKYVFGIGIGVFIAEVGKLDAGAHKIQMLAWYFSSFAISLVATVSFMVFLVIRSHRVAKSLGYCPEYSTSDAVADYLVKGYYYYRKSLVEQKALHRPDYSGMLEESFALYTERICYSIMATLSKGDEASKIEASREILRYVSSVVNAFHKDAAGKKAIKTCLMLVRNCDQDLRKRMVFVSDKQRKIVRRCLELVVYDDGSGNGLILPLPEKSESALALPGGPAAALSDNTQVVTNTAQISFNSGVAQPVKKEIKEYFRKQKFKSFASLCVSGDRAEVIAVINVESATTGIFGSNAKDQELFSDALRPFCSTVGLIFADPVANLGSHP